MTEPVRPDCCPVCTRLIAGVGVLIHCDICGTTLLPDPDHPVTPPPDSGSVWTWTGVRWVPWCQEEDGWMRW